MTVIAWDGKTLAADRRSTHCGYASTATKIHRVPGGIVGFSGGGAHSSALLEWFKGGRQGEYPKAIDEEHGAGSTFITDAGVILAYAWHSQSPETIEDKFFARGAGRDYALAAMYLGHDARKAVEVACALEVSCGNGVDTLELHPKGGAE